MGIYSSSSLLGSDRLCYCMDLNLKTTILQVWVLDKLLNSSKCQFASLKIYRFLFCNFVMKDSEVLNLKDSLAPDIYLVL